MSGMPLVLRYNTRYSSINYLALAQLSPNSNDIGRLQSQEILYIAELLSTRCIIFLFPLMFSQLFKIRI
jgi:hypothetical protein